MPAKRANMTQEQRENDLAKTRAWRAANPDKMRAYKNKYYKNNPAQQKKEARAHYLKHRSEILERLKLEYHNDPEHKRLNQGREARHKNPEHFRNLRRAHKEKNPYLWRVYGARKSARNKGVECDLDVEWFRVRLEDGHCEMSGLPFEYEGGPKSANYPTIDRIDPKGPYTKANCRMILWWLNRAMIDLGDEYAISVFKAVIAKKAQQQ